MPHICLQTQEGILHFGLHVSSFSSCNKQPAQTQCWFAITSMDQLFGWSQLGWPHCVLSDAGSVHSQVCCQKLIEDKNWLSIADMSCGGVIVTRDKIVKWVYPIHHSLLVYLDHCVLMATGEEYSHWESLFHTLLVSYLVMSDWSKQMIL